MAKKDTPQLTVAIATHNEEVMLPDCLASIQHIADEIVVVDGASTDKTVEIAKKFGARVIETDNPKMFHINKQKALDASKGVWVMQLDADERVSPALAQQIVSVVKGNGLPNISPKQDRLFSLHQSNIEARDGQIGTKQGEVVAYFVPRLNYFLGGYLRHGGVYPDGIIRLVKKGSAHWPSKNVHEQMEIQGKVAWLSEDLLHYGDPNFARYLKRADTYTSLTAKELQTKGVKLNFGNHFQYLFVKPVVVFLQLFFRHKGLLDGFPGFIWALFSGLHYPMAYMKYWELEHVR